MIGPEEKRRILQTLHSHVVATRFMALKRLSSMARDTPSEFEQWELEDSAALEELLLVIRDMENESGDESLQREAKICLRTIKSTLGPKYRKTALRCPSCRRVLCYGWGCCPYCGALVQYSEENRCPDCKMSLDSEWIFCVKCGRKLKEPLISSRCPQCNMEIHENWVVCPLCGKMLK